MKKKRDAATAEKNRAFDAVQHSYAHANIIPTNTQLPSSTTLDPKATPSVTLKITPSSYWAAASPNELRNDSPPMEHTAPSSLQNPKSDPHMQ